MDIIAVDQSLSCTGLCVHFENKDTPYTIRTASSTSKSIPEGVPQFDTIEERIEYISRSILPLWSVNNAHYVLESLSYGSIGNATRDLAMLVGAITTSLLRAGVSRENIFFYTPQTLKSFMREKLPLDRQTVIGESGKPLKVKMDKKLMVQAAKTCCPEGYFDGYTMSGKNGGLGDIADAYGLYLLHKHNLEDLNK